MSKRALEKLLRPMRFIPGHLKTQEMFDKAVRREPWNLTHVPDWFVTLKQIKIWYNYVYYCNDDRLIRCYNGSEKRKVQKAQIKQGLMLIAWHSSRWWDWCVPEDEKKETEKLFLTTWYAKIKNVLIKEDVEIWSKKGYNQRLSWTNTNKLYIYDQCKQAGGIW